MNVVGHIPQTDVTEDVEADTPKEAVRLFKCKYPHALVEMIDGDIVVGICEGCERPIMESEGATYVYNSDDGIFLCEGCKPK